jgi:transposase
MEAALPPFIRAYAGTGRKPYPYQPFIRSVWAKCFFKINTNTELIRRLKSDPNLRLLCGFDMTPGKSTFSRNIGELSETSIMQEALDKLVKLEKYRRLWKNCERKLRNTLQMAVLAFISLILRRFRTDS